MNIVRTKILDKVYRFKPFTVRDYRSLLLIRNDLDNNSVDKNIELLDECLEDLFPDVPKQFRGYCFVKTFTTSIGKTTLPMGYQCPKCGKKHKIPLDISQNDIVHPILSIGDIQIKFTYPDDDRDLESMVLDNIHSVVQDDQEYAWNELPDGDKLAIIKAITLEDIEKILEQMKPIFFKLDMNCCENRSIIYTTFFDIFKVLIHPDEIFQFYQINHVMAKNNYPLGDIYDMMPIERSIILSLIEKDKNDSK